MSDQTPTPTRGVKLVLDKERRLRFSLKTMRLLRKEFGEQTLATGLDQDNIAKFLWFGLKHEDPDLTVEQVEEMVDLEQLDEVMNVVVTATGNRGRIEQFKASVAAAANRPTAKEAAVVGSVEAAVAADDEDRPPEPVPEEPTPQAMVEVERDTGPEQDKDVEKDKDVEVASEESLTRTPD